MSADPVEGHEHPNCTRMKEPQSSGPISFEMQGKTSTGINSAGAGPEGNAKCHLKGLHFLNGKGFHHAIGSPKANKSF